MLDFNKISKLKKLLRIDDKYMNLHNLTIDENEEEQNIEQEDIIKLDKLYFEKTKRRNVKKPTDLVVKPVVKEEDDYIYINDNLPKIPFSMIMSGARGAGKTTATHFLINSLNKYFDEIIIFSPTLELDVKYKMLFEKLDREFEVGKNIFFKYSEDILTRVLRKIKKVNKNKPFKDKVAVLIVFDDIICALPKQQRKTIFNKLLLNNRHYNVSIIINSQSFSLFDTSLRKNCSQIVIYKTDNLKELKNYYEEFSGLLGVTAREQKENFIKLYNYATCDKHSFLYINSHNRPNIFFKNFDEIINVPDIVSKPLEYYSPDLLKKNVSIDDK